MQLFTIIYSIVRMNEIFFLRNLRKLPEVKAVKQECIGVRP